MSEEQKYKIAQEYVDSQLETMRRFDAAPSEISDAEYKSLIDEVAELVHA